MKSQSEFTTRKGLVMLGILLIFFIALAMFALYYPGGCVRMAPLPW